MKNRNYIKPIAFLCIVVMFLIIDINSAKAATPVVLKYKSQPIKITLSVGHEKQITFRNRVWVDVPDRILGKVKITVVGNNLYIAANESFKSQRIEIGEEGSNDTYLFDMQAKNIANTGEVKARFLIQKTPDRFDPLVMQKETDQARELNIPIRKPLGYAGLIKFASRELYAPDRLRGGVPGVTRSTLAQAKHINHLVRGHTVNSKTVAAWKSGRYYVTALRLQNKTTKPIILDPREVRGAWLAVSFQHNRLGHKGTDTDTTAVYLVSDRPFYEVIRNTAIRVGG